MLLAKNSDAATKFQKELASNVVTKKYMARVIGRFPYDKIEVNQPMNCIDHVKHTWGVVEGGVSAVTRFKLVWTDEKTRYFGHGLIMANLCSILKCKPLTGRTHQIRVHLQWLGHPIINDPLYNSYYSTHRTPITQCNSEAVLTNRLEKKVEKLPYNLETYLTDYEPNGLLELLQNCIDCKTERRDPFPEELFIYLHAYQYKGKDWRFTSKIPVWAEKDFEDPDYFQKSEQNKHFS